MASPPSLGSDPTLTSTLPLDASPHDLSPESGIALCLSGGGYRAMLFHVGSLWRLNEACLLPKLRRISSVSGGSITAAYLGLKWSELDFDETGLACSFVPVVVHTLRMMAGRTIDVRSILGGLLSPWTSVAERVAAAYGQYLFGDHTLQDLPDEPRFVFNATNMQTGDLWRFSKPYMGDYQVGLVKHPRTSLAVVVAASSAFPPFLSPMTLSLEPGSVASSVSVTLHRRPFATHIVLSDGGVYDNLGLESAFKRFNTFLVSDGGAKLVPEPSPRHNWAGHSYRVLSVVDNQVCSLRKRLLLESYLNKSRKGAYWGIRTNIADYQLDNALDCPHGQTLKLAAVSTRLQWMPPTLQDRLINWGYAVCGAALRRHAKEDLQTQFGLDVGGRGQFPYACGV
jgi:NTE family protein